MQESILFGVSADDLKNLKDSYVAPVRMEDGLCEICENNKDADFYSVYGIQHDNLSTWLADFPTEGQCVAYKRLVDAAINPMVSISDDDIRAELERRGFYVRNLWHVNDARVEFETLLSENPDRPTKELSDETCLNILDYILEDKTGINEAINMRIEEVYFYDRK